MFTVVRATRATSGKAINRCLFASAKSSKPFYRRFITPTTVGLAAIGGITYYAYTHPYDKKAYIESLEDPTAYEVETLTPKQVAAHTMLLNRTGSRLLGKLMDIKVPLKWREPLYSRVSKWVGIDVTEFAGTFEDYETPNSFFTRSLKPSVLNFSPPHRRPARFCRATSFCCPPSTAPCRF